MSVGLRGAEHENEFFVDTAAAVGFDSAASLARGVLYALFEGDPRAETVRRELGIDRPNDPETEEEIEKGRALIEAAVSRKGRKISVSPRT